MSRLAQGNIIRARVRDRRGRNPKIRPLVLITSTPELQSSDVLVAVAITGEFVEPVAEDEVLLPWHPGGKPRTGLRKPSVAKCSWLCQIRRTDVIEVKGHVPQAQMEQILAYVRAM